MRFLASTQDEDMAALKDSTVYAPLPPNAASRGRDNYSLYGVLRTKPGRADSPPTLSMSCSDKIAAWNVLGMQGALASGIFDPIYASAIVIGDVDHSMRAIVREDCERALFGRLAGLTGIISTSPNPFRADFLSPQTFRAHFVSTAPKYTSPRLISSIHDLDCRRRTRTKLRRRPATSVSSCSPEGQTPHIIVRFLSHSALLDCIRDSACRGHNQRVSKGSRCETAWSGKVPVSPPSCQSGLMRSSSAQFLQPYRM